MKKIALFVDWENIRKGVFEKASQSLNLFVDYNDPANLIRFFSSFVDTSDEDMYRIFIYLSSPRRVLHFDDHILTNRTYNRTKQFIDNIAMHDLIAVRKGKIKFRGYDSEGNPILLQKQVDMLMGLDIAHVSYLKLVDRVLIFSFDTDIIPAMKTARINGLQVVLPSLPDTCKAPKDMVRHADIVRSRNFRDIFTPDQNAS